MKRTTMTGRPRLQLDEKKLRAMWGKEKVEAIAIALGCSSATVLFRGYNLGLPQLNPARGRRLTDSQKAALDADVRSGMRTEDIATKHGLHISSVRQALRRVKGATRRRWKWDTAKLRIACDQGLTLEEIAKAVGAPESTVRHKLNRIGLRYRRIQRRKPCDVRAMAADWRSRLPWAQIARRHGFKSAWGVVYRLEREGIPVRRERA